MKLDMNTLRKRIQTLLLCSFLSVSLIAGCASATPSGTPTEKENTDSGNQTVSSEALQPAYAVICDSAKNPADDRTLELLKQCGASTYETKDGDISIVCDGESIEVTQ